jgi:hypothetical protein
MRKLKRAKRRPATKRHLDFYIVIVGQALRGRVREALKPFALIEEQGYCDGSTSWRFLIECERNAREIKEAIWAVPGLAQISVIVNKAHF